MSVCLSTHSPIHPSIWRWVGRYLQYIIKIRTPAFLVDWDSFMAIVMGYVLGSRVLLPAEAEDFLFFRVFSLVLYALSPIQWVQGAFSPGLKLPGHDTDSLLPCSVEVKNMWMYLCSPYSSWHDAYLHTDNFRAVRNQAHYFAIWSPCISVPFIQYCTSLLEGKCFWLGI
jgi:hypothetical protein